MFKEAASAVGAGTWEGWFNGGDNKSCLEIWQSMHDSNVVVGHPCMRKCYSCCSSSLKRGLHDDNLSTLFNLHYEKQGMYQLQFR